VDNFLSRIADVSQLEVVMFHRVALL